MNEQLVVTNVPRLVIQFTYSLSQTDVSGTMAETQETSRSAKVQWHYAVDPTANEGHCNERCIYGVHFNESDQRYYKMPDEAIVSWRNDKFLTCPYCGVVASNEHEYAIKEHKNPWAKAEVKSETEEKKPSDSK